MKLHLELEYEWVPVTCNDGAPYAYPRPVREVRNSFHAPAVYRWRFLDGDETAALYFGECDDMVKQLNASVNPGPGQKAASRIKAALGERMLLGQTGVVDVLSLKSLTVGGAALTSEPLKDVNVRRAIENMLIHEAAQRDFELLNHETSARDLLSLL